MSGPDHCFFLFTTTNDSKADAGSFDAAKGAFSPPAGVLGLESAPPTGHQSGARDGTPDEGRTSAGGPGANAACAAKMRQLYHRRHPAACGLRLAAAAMHVASGESGKWALRDAACVT